MGVIRVQDLRRVRTITFTRPEVLNAFNTELYDATAAALEDAEGDDSIACVVLTGEGRAFSAGQDLGEMARLGGGEDARPGAGRGFPRLMNVVGRFPKPLLAAVNGLAVGLGFTILAHCDLVLVADDARLRVPFAQLGVAPEAASSYLFPARMGWQRAAHALLTGDWVSARELVETGLAIAACDPTSVVAETCALAERIAAASLPSLMATKRLMLAGRGDGVAAARVREDAAYAELLGQAANADALRQFLDGRDGS
jgi:enoyl-CoA hydratase/carnithine racemase